MTQRTLAAVIALPLVLALVILAWVVPLPYTIYRPGPTENVLAQVKVNPKDHPVYPGNAEIWMTTVNETLRDTHLGLLALLQAWADKDAAVYPTSVAYAPSQTQQQDQQQGQQQMATAQQTAAYVALEQLGYHVFVGAEVEQAPQKGAPAYGKLRKGDVITAVNSTKINLSTDLIATVHALKAGQPATFTFRRGGATHTVRITPIQQDGVSLIGIGAPGDATKMPFPVNVDVPQEIGGPSAGLMMALAIYDYLTPGSLTGGEPIAGTGTISDDGTVGPIGGIQQKIPGAMHAGAKLFLVPADNCEDVLNSDHGSMRLARVTTMRSAVRVVEVWAADHNAVLPSCGSNP